jgi:hypothetical protein
MMWEGAGNFMGLMILEWGGGWEFVFKLTAPTLLKEKSLHSAHETEVIWL